MRVAKARMHIDKAYISLKFQFWARESIFSTEFDIAVFGSLLFQAPHAIEGITQILS